MGRDNIDNNWQETAGMSRKERALYEDTKEWIDHLENDAHWARTPDERKAKLDQAEILQDLLKAARR